MPVVPQIRAVTSELNTPDMLRYLIKERFPGKTVVTASLRSSSIIVLKMVADIDPATPVVFCRPGSLFPESESYRNQIIGLLGLTNVDTSVGRESEVSDGDVPHCERMWVEYETTPGRSFQIVHLNRTLEPYDCWISAVYHQRERPSHVSRRVEREGRLIRVDPLIHWSKDDVRAYMVEHAIPYHKRAYRNSQPVATEADGVAVPTWAF